MKDLEKTKEQLITELNEARQQLKDFTAAEAERKEVNQYVKQWRETFYQAFDANPTALCLINAVDSRFIRVNDSFARFAGYTKEEIIGHTHQELNLWVNPDDMKNMEKSLQTTGLLVNAEIKSRMKSGEVRIGLFSAHTIELESKRYLLLIITDITDVKKMEAALRESENKLVVAFRASPHALIIATMGDGKFIEVNDNVCKLTGYSREEIIGHTVDELKIWEDPDFRMRMAKALLEKGRVHNAEVVWHHRSGEAHNMLMSAEITEIGGKKCIVSSVTDITEMKKMQQALRNSEEKFTKAFRSSPGILSISKIADGTFLEINDSFTRILGFTREETIGHSSLELKIWVNPADREKMISELSKLGRVSNEEYHHRTKSGEIRTFLFSAEYIPFSNEPCVLTFASDITDYKRMEAQALEAKNLKEVDRLRTELLANVSHELRTPLASIKGFATMLLDYSKRLNSHEKREYLEIIDKNVDRLVELIEQLLEMSRLGTGMLSINKTLSNVNNLCETVITEARVREPKHHFVLELPQKPPIMMIDEKRIRQVLDNLINNAAKYSNTGTGITLAVQRTNNDMVFSVTDHGIGIPEKDMPRVFHRMFHSQQGQKHGVQGAGLGLSICKGLVEAHGGKIWIESKQGVGTSAYFSIPIEVTPENNTADTPK
jgi:PAS domain S-box-containing protein